MGWVINPVGKLEPVRPAPQERSPEGTLQRLSRCQTFLDRIMDCLPEETGVSGSPDRVTQSALNILLRESFRVYASFRESFEAMAGSFPDYKNQRRDLARGIAKRAASQSLRLQSFYEDCRRIVVGKNLDYPHVLVISMDDVSAMDEFQQGGGCPGVAAWRLLPPGDSGHQSLAAPSHIRPVGTLGAVEEAGGGCDRGEEEEEDTSAVFDASPSTLFSPGLETKISTEWVAFDDGAEEVPVSLAGDDHSVESGKDLLLSWVVFDDRKTLPVEEILTIEIKPGWKKGTKITFPEKGNEQPNVIPSDLVFIVDEKPHDVFTRDGNDLIVTQKISLVEALTGYTVHLTTLNGRSLSIPINNVIHPGYEEVIPKEGMPIPKDPTKRGNLRIKFNIKFPTRLTAEQKAGIKRLLAS